MNEQAADLLLQCLRQDARVDRGRLSALAAEEWASLRSMASAHGVQELLLSRLAESGLDTAMPESMLADTRDAARRAAVRSLGLLRDLDRVGEALHAARIPVIALKGAHLARAVYTSAALRSMSDVDLLVHAGDLARATSALEIEGYAPRAPAGKAVEPPTANPYHLPRFFKRGAVGIELHWTLPSPSAFCDEQGVWDRAVPLRTGDGNLLALCPEDLLLHLCAHASYQHYFEMGLRPACDVAATIERYRDRLDWTAVVARAQQWRWDRGTYLSLRLAREMLGATVPDSALCALRPADFDETFITAARTLTLLDSRTHRALPATLGAATAARGARQRVVEVLRRVFLPRALVANLYAVSPRSFKVLLYYPIRLKDLLRRHAHLAFQLFGGDPILRSITTQKAAIRYWLSHTA